MRCNDERLSALRDFDATKTGVKGLTHGGITCLPSIFIFHAPLPIHHLPSHHLSIPTIDLSLPSHLAIPSLLSASRQWCFFCITNHSIPHPLLSRAITVVRSFHTLLASERSYYYNRSATKDIKYLSNVNLFRSATASWRDTLRFENTAAIAERGPAICREDLVEWDVAALAVARKVLGMLAKGMGIDEGMLDNMCFLERRKMVCHCYPPCPEPEKTMGDRGAQ